MSQWDNLTQDEINYMIHKRMKEIRSLKQEFIKRNSIDKNSIVPIDLEKGTMHMLNILDIKANKVMKTDILDILNSFYSDYEWKDKHGAYTNDLLSLCVVTEVLNHYEINYDLEYGLDSLDLDKQSYFRLYYKLNEFSRLYYWKD